MGTETVLIEKRELVTTEALTFAIWGTRELLQEHHWPQPPLPDDVMSLAPCGFRVTQIHGAGGQRTGKIKFSDPNGNTIYEQEWIIIR
jgi:hypothetical protein